jgi:Flp pilus assembly CpaF family ATPase
MQTDASSQFPRLPRARKRRLLTFLGPAIALLPTLAAHAQAGGSDPWDNAVNVLKTAFTGTIATGLSLVAIVVGGLMFAYGEGQSKKMLAGIVFGIGMAIGAVKFTSQNFTMSDLIDRKMLTAAQAEILATRVRHGDNLLISGSTSSGKTTLANVLAGFIPDGDRILILEDVAEISIRKPHVISAEAQLDTHKCQIGFSDLLKAALRHRPDRIIVGEIRGAEARVFLDALNTGHRGSLSTIHANSAEDALLRLAQLAMRGSGGGIPLQHVEEECRRSIDLVVHVVNQDGWRKITEIRTSAKAPIKTSR